MSTVVRCGLYVEGHLQRECNLERLEEIARAHPRVVAMTLGSEDFATAIGMVLYGHRSRQARMNIDRGLGAKLKALFAR